MFSCILIHTKQGRWLFSVEQNKSFVLNVILQYITVHLQYFA
jgi:hypothetical protein